MMKKLLASTIAFSLLLPATAQASAIKASDMKVSNKDYNATIIKDTKVMNREVYGYSNQKLFSNIKKGTKVIITKTTKLNGHKFFVLKGNKYIPAKDSLIQVTGMSKTKISYDKAHLSPYAKSLLNQKGIQKKKYYNEYKKEILKSDKEYQKWAAGKEDLIAMELVGKHEAITLEAFLMPTYKDWVQAVKH